MTQASALVIFSPQDGQKQSPKMAQMGAIQLGIQHALKNLQSESILCSLVEEDFKTFQTTNFPTQGSDHTPVHCFPEFTFNIYAPKVFTYIWNLFDIEYGDLLMSITGGPFKQLSNSGASGSSFYLTSDDGFIIKTLQPKEEGFLRQILPAYYEYLKQNPRTFLPKFFGLYCYRSGGKNMKLVLMNNIIAGSIVLHQKYDLKGSTFNRKASQNEIRKGCPTYKDLDFIEDHPEGIIIEANIHNALIETIQRDCAVLEKFGIMDYSLLLTIHNLDKAQTVERERGLLRDNVWADPDGHMIFRKRGREREPDVSYKNKFIWSQRLAAAIASTSKNFIPGSIPAWNAKGEHLLLFIGIIDILQCYTVMRKIQHALQLFLPGDDTLSIQQPSVYSERFQNFMTEKVFKKKEPPEETGIAYYNIRASTVAMSLVAIAIICICMTIFKGADDQDQMNFSFLEDFNKKVSHAIVPRSQWGAKAPLHQERIALPTDLVIITHTLTPFCYSFRECSTLLTSAQTYDFQAGMSDIADNFLIGSGGYIYEGRGWDYTNAHRAESVTISFIGNFLFEDLTYSMIEALTDLLGKGVELGKLSSYYRLVCYNQTRDSMSPGENIYEVIKALEHFEEDKLY